MKKENFLKLVILVLVIISSSLYVYTIKEMSNRGYSTSENLILRGILCLSIGIIVSKINGFQLIPQK